MAAAKNSTIIFAVYDDPVIGGTIQARLADRLKDGMLSHHRVQLTISIVRNKDIKILYKNLS